MSFFYVYILQSVTNPDRFYVGFTKDFKTRLKMHNSKNCFHTKKHVPWKIKNIFGFETEAKAKARAFEKYLKSYSGRAFSKKHF